ncbi:MAG: metallophosphoesterase, partial [Gemmataceae bacterium]
MTLLLTAFACLGHFVLLVGTHNWFYGQNYPKWLSKLLHLVHLLAVLALPAGLLAGWGPTLDRLFVWPPSCAAHAAVLAYLAVCALTAAVWLPVLTRARASRPAAVTAGPTEVVDLAARLGLAAVRGGHPLARLPRSQIYHVEYRELTVHLQRLPAALDGLTVLHLTDLHFHGTPNRAYFDAIVERCNAWKPDIVAVTGDVVDSERHHRWILPVLGKLRWNVAGFAILGNHDHRLDAARIRRRLSRVGLRALPNVWEPLAVRGTEVQVIGHEGPWLAPEPDLSGCPVGPFRLCLSHTPDNIGWAGRHGIDLMLSGHVHGGQIRFPVFGAVFIPSVYGRRYDEGAFRCPPTLLVVSRGVSGEHPVRYGCLPEVSLLTLRRQP